MADCRPPVAHHLLRQLDRACAPAFAARPGGGNVGRWDERSAIPRRPVIGFVSWEAVERRVSTARGEITSPRPAVEPSTAAHSSAAPPREGAMAATLIALNILALRCNTYPAQITPVAPDRDLRRAHQPLHQTILLLRRAHLLDGVRRPAAASPCRPASAAKRPTRACATRRSSAAPRTGRASSTSRVLGRGKRNCSCHVARRELQPMTLGAPRRGGARRGARLAASARLAHAHARESRLVEELAPLALLALSSLPPPPLLRAPCAAAAPPH